MKLKLLCAAALGGVLALVLGVTAMAQGEPPAPYAGMKNPFPWDDSAARAAGQPVYKQNCLGCHGTGGDAQKAFDFSKPEFSQGLQGRPDFYMWVISEGRLANGMPGFKGSLSEQQRWQVLTYMSSLGTPGAAGSPTQTPEAPKGFLRLAAPEQAVAGQPFTLKASFEDADGKPVGGVDVTFFVGAELFTTGDIEIGDATTNEQGIASLDYTPGHTGDVAALVRYGSNEGRANITVSDGVESSYQAEAGIHFPEIGPGGIIYPKSVLELRPGLKAPLPAFHLPGGIASWMLLLVITVLVIWSTYFRVIYQVFRISPAGGMGGMNTRLIPMLGMAFVASVGAVLILKLLISPYTHLHIPMV